MWSVTAFDRPPEAAKGAPALARLHEEEGECGSPHVPSVLESFLKKGRPSAQEMMTKGIMHISECTPPASPRSLADIIDGPALIDTWLLDEDVSSPHIPNQLERKLRRRLSKELIKEQGLLKSPIEQVTQSLQHKARAASIEQALQRRPTVTQLVESGILQAGY